MLIIQKQIAKQISRETFKDEKLFDLMMTCLADHVFSIREAACTQIQKIVDIYGFEWARDVVLPKVFELAAEQNYLRRMTVLFQINFLMSATLNNKSEMVSLPGLSFFIAVLGRHRR